MKYNREKSIAEEREEQELKRVQKFLKSIKTEVECSRPVSDADARKFVKLCLAPNETDSRRILSVEIVRAYQGNPSLVVFSLVGSPVRGHALLYPYNGSLKFQRHAIESYVLKIQNYTGTSPRRTRDVSSLTMFLQVARAKAKEQGGAFQPVDRSRNH